MKKIIILASLASIIFSGCNNFNPETLPHKKKNITDSTTNGETTNTTSGNTTIITNGCAATVTNLYAGQHNLAGNVTVTNDAVNLYITYNTTGGWVLKHTHVYAGPLAGLPKSSKGNPKIGNFPYQTAHIPSVTSFTYTIPLAKVGSDSCFIIATHAEVFRVSADGQTQQAETAWGAGTQITAGGSWASYFDYCKCKSRGTTTSSGTTGSTTCTTKTGSSTSGSTTSTTGSTTSASTTSGTTTTGTTTSSTTSGRTTDTLLLEN